MKHLKLRNDLRWVLCVVALYYMLFVGFFTYNFGLSKKAYYAFDAFLLLLLLLCLPKWPKLFFNKDIWMAQTYIYALVVIGTVSAFVYGFHFPLWIWAIRNWGRMILFFFAFCVLLKEKNADKVIAFFVKLYDINTVTILFQHFFLRSHYGRDQLNGLFGRTTNAFNIAVSLVVLCIVMSGYFSKKYGARRLIVSAIEIGIVAALAELRAVLVFVVFFFIAYALINFRGALNQIIAYSAFVAFLLLAMMAASIVLGKLYPGMNVRFDIPSIIEAASTKEGYGHHGYIDRLTAIPVINQYFFDDAGIWSKAFGMGIGNAEYSSFEFLQSAFYRKYGEKFLYLNFTSSAIYLETGITGILLYAGAYIYIFVKYAKKIRKGLARKQDSKQLFYNNIGFGAALICIIFVVYNNLQRGDAGIVLSLFLAVPFAKRRDVLGYGKSD